jgi:hypothetical protein
LRDVRRITRTCGPEGAGPEKDVQPADYFPHVDLILQSMRIDCERLNGRGKIAIDAPLLRLLLQSAVARLPFSAPFYLATYPDIAAAAASGQITDLHRHYIDTGWFEGRMGSPPEVDEAAYRGAYADVADAIAEGRVRSAHDHYMQSGAAEGRVPAPALAGVVAQWMRVLRIPVPGEI